MFTINIYNRSLITNLLLVVVVVVVVVVVEVVVVVHPTCFNILVDQISTSPDIYFTLISYCCITMLQRPNEENLR